MNSLMNYGSDDDYDDSSEEKQKDWRASSSRDKGPPSKATDVNYEEVQMDLSEGSNDSRPEPPPPSSRQASRNRSSRDRDARDRRDSSQRDHKDRRGSRDKDKESRSSRGRRDRDRERERDRKSRRSSSRDRDRDRKESSRRSRTPPRRSRTPPRRSRSPPRRSERESKHSRSRSRSRDRARKYAKRYERASGKSEPAEKNERQKTNDEEKRTNQSEGDRFFMPGITGRFRDQIERRKQLWQKKDVPAAAAAATAAAKVPVNNGQSKKVWEATTFAQDTDGKVASKFKRLMGIRGNQEAPGPAVDNLRKQEEMFSSMEQQYEVARTATHTMRGVGLGFGSFQR